MKNFKTVILLLTACTLPLFLGGCLSKKSPTDSYHEAIEDNNTVIRANGISYFQTKEKRDAAVFEKLQNNETAAVLYAIVSDSRDRQVLQTLKPQKVEKPTTGMDVLNTAAGSTVPTIVKNVFGYLKDVKLFDALGGPKIEINGDDNQYQSGNQDSLNDFDIGNDFGQYTDKNGQYHMKDDKSQKEDGGEEILEEEGGEEATQEVTE